MSLKVSVLTVAYNSEYTIEETIKSVLEQSYINIEYVICDGGSIDSTLGIIEKYKYKINRVISEKDSGIYNAINKGLSIITGDIVAILNSDDVYCDNRVIERVVSEFENKNVDCVYGDLLYVKRNNLDEVIRYWKTSEFEIGCFSNGWHPAHPSFFVKKNIYDKYGNYDESMKVSADFEFMIRVLEKYKITSSYLPHILVKMRVGGESNKSILNVINGNLAVLDAFDKNQININKIKYLFNRIKIKIKQFKTNNIGL